MLELNSKRLQVKFNGVEYDLKFPTVKEIGAYNENYKKSDDKIQLIIEFISSLGMPSEICEQLEIEHLELLLEELTTAKK